MKRVGITGGIGSGKSTICDIFKTLDIPVYYADDRAKHLMNHDAQLREAIIQSFGANSYTETGLNRTYLASQIFTDEINIRKINALVHPAVKKDFALWSDRQSSPYVLQEAALLVDNQSYQSLDNLITVYASTEIRIKRVLSRDKHRTEEQVEQIIGKQVSEEARQAVADFVINNDEQCLLIPQVLDIHQKILSLA